MISVQSIPAGSLLLADEDGRRTAGTADVEGVAGGGVGEGGGGESVGAGTLLLRAALGTAAAAAESAEA